MEVVLFNVIELLATNLWQLLLKEGGFGSPRMDLLCHVTDGKTQFLPWVSSYWHVASGFNWLNKMWKTNRQICVNY